MLVLAVLQDTCKANERHIPNEFAEESTYLAHYAILFPDAMQDRQVSRKVATQLAETVEAIIVEHGEMSWRGLSGSVK